MKTLKVVIFLSKISVVVSYNRSNFDVSGDQFCFDFAEKVSDSCGFATSVNSP